MPDKEAIVAEEKKDYYTVGNLRKALQELPDDTPIAAAPLNDNVRVTIDVSIVPEAKIGDYTGRAVLFIAGLFDNNTGKEITLVVDDKKADAE